MPRYLVKEPGFFNGTYYDPQGKRPFLETDEPFTKKNPMPSWLAEVPKESAAVKAKRKALEKAHADLEKAKKDADQEAIDAASSQGDGEGEQSFMGKVTEALGGKKSKVETI